MVKWIASAIVALLATLATGALEIPEALQVMYADERQQHPGTYEITPKFKFPERNGLIQIDVLEKDLISHIFKKLKVFLTVIL